MVDTQIGCAFGNTAQAKEEDLRLIATGQKSDEEAHNMKELADMLDGTGRIQKFLANCALCHGKPEDAPAEQVCPLAMGEFELSLEHLANNSRIITFLD
jgi:hypothetical protein